MRNFVRRSCVGLHWALERGPFLLLRFGHRRGDHAVFPEDRLVGCLLVFTAQQERVERYLVRGDADDAELGEELLAFFSVPIDEHIVGRAPAERPPRIAVEVRQRQRNLLLRERVEGCSLLEDAPKLVVEALDVGLLR